MLSLPTELLYNSPEVNAIAQRLPESYQTTCCLLFRLASVFKVHSTIAQWRMTDPEERIMYGDIDAIGVFIDQKVGRNFFFDTCIEVGILEERIDDMGNEVGILFPRFESWFERSVPENNRVQPTLKKETIRDGSALGISIEDAMRERSKYGDRERRGIIELDREKDAPYEDDPESILTEDWSKLELEDTQELKKK